MLEMARKQYLPAMIAFSGDVAKAVGMKKAVLPTLDCAAEQKLVQTLTGLINAAGSEIEQLSDDIDAALAQKDALKQAVAIRDTVLPAMNALRKPVDQAETLVDERLWPTPGYGQLLMTK